MNTRNTHRYGIEVSLKKSKKCCRICQKQLSKKNPERYKLAAQYLNRIYDYSKQSKKRFDFLESSIGLLDSRNTFHRDFDMKHVLVKEILKTIESQIEDGPSEDDSDIQLFDCYFKIFMKNKILLAKEYLYH